MCHFIENSPNSFSCGICSKRVQVNHRYMICSHCKRKIHIKCNEIDANSYESIKSNNKDWICLLCNENIFPFFSLDQRAEISNKPFFNNTSDSIKRFFNGINEFNNHNQNPKDDDMNISDFTPPLNCNYHDIESFDFKRIQNELSFFHLNISSLSKNKDELETILSMLDFKFDIIGLTETKIRKNYPTTFDINLKGYHASACPTESEKGGTLLYISKSLKFKERKDLEKIMYKSCDLESTFVEITNSQKKNIICASIYKHPKMDLDDFNTKYLNPLLDKISKENKTIFLLGDFNVDLMKSDKDLNTTNFFDCMTSHLMVPHIIYPTRITSHSKTLIDNIFSNSLNFEQGKSGNITLSISDHLAQFLIIPEKYSHLTEKINIQKRDMKNLNKENLLNDLSNVNWNSLICLDKEDPNFSYTVIEKAVNSIVDEHAPTKILTKKEIKLQSKPWITQGIRISIKRREKVYKKYLRAKDNDTKEKYHRLYKNLRNQLVTLCRDSKMLHYQAFFTKNAKNSKNIWKGINSIVNFKETTNFQIDSLLVENNFTNDSKEIADNMNEYFSTVANQLQEKIFGGFDFKKYLTNRCENTFFINPTNKFEIADEIQRLNTNKSIGPHSIDTRILKEIDSVIAEPLADIINLSFQNGVYIDCLKKSKIIPIYKQKGDKLLCNNYRPISLLSNINKIIEKIMYKRLYSFLSINKCIYDLQFGFRNNHSTNHALIDLTEDIRESLDNNNLAIGVFIDLQKAFDTVQHDILLYKLDHYGIRGVANDWLRSYLSNRHQVVCINGIDSNLKFTNIGVPQGSVLGPLLFLVYINDLNKAIRFSKTRLFADDTSLLTKGKSPKQLQKFLNLDLKNLCKWLKANKISLNTSKTELIIFKNHKKAINFNFKIMINGRKLIPTNYVKYLGIYLDSNLNWSHHCDILSAKLSRANGILSKLRHYVTSDTLREVYHAIFSSLMSYSAQIYGQSANKHVNRISKLQDKAIRIINFANFKTSRSNLYKQSKILKFFDQVKLLNFLFVHDCLNYNVPLALNNNFKLQGNRHSYMTKASLQNQVSLPKSNTQTYGIKSIMYQSCHIWNSMMDKHANKNLLIKSRNFCKRFIVLNMINDY